MRIPIFLICLLLGLVLSPASIAQTLEQAPRFDPYMPGELNERALYSLQEHAISTALILLERAYRLNPNSPDIKANLEIVREIAREKIPVELQGNVVHLDAIGNPIQESIITETPALWPEPEP